MGGRVNLSRLHEQVAKRAGNAPSWQAVNNVKRPASAATRQLENRTSSVGSAAAAIAGRAIEISLAVEDQACIRNPSVVFQSEFVKDGFRPFGCGPFQFENRTVAIATSGGSCAIEVAGGIQGDACDRDCPVRARAKAV